MREQVIGVINRGRARGQAIQRSGDFVFLIVTLALVIFGVIMVFSASYYYALNTMGNPYHYLIRNGIFALAGFLLLLVGASVDYHRYMRWAPWVMLLGVILLVLVVTPLGTEVNGAKRWLGTGIFSIMPGEVAKPCVILFVAWYLSMRPERILSFTRGILPLFALCGVLGALVMLQPNMSTAITIVGIVVVIMFTAGMHYRYLVLLGVLGAVGIWGLTRGEDNYRSNRLTSFLDPFQDAKGDGYQVVQSLLAMGSGGIFGVGLGKSVQKTLYLPEPQNDFILAIIGEELGFVGILILMIGYLLLIWRGIKIAMDAPDRFGTLLASGIVGMLGIQVILNVAVVTSSMPPTGVILPFVSYGGNALLILMFLAGVMLNISRHGKRKGAGKQ